MGWFVRNSSSCSVLIYPNANLFCIVQLWIYGECLCGMWMQSGWRLNWVQLRCHQLPVWINYLLFCEFDKWHYTQRLSIDGKRYCRRTMKSIICHHEQCGCMLCCLYVRKSKHNIFDSHNVNEQFRCGRTCAQIRHIHIISGWNGNETLLVASQWKFEKRRMKTLSATSAQHIGFPLLMPAQYENNFKPFSGRTISSAPPTIPSYSFVTVCVCYVVKFCIW